MFCFSDIDECILGINTCSPLELCVNTLGSFNCEGDGGREGGGRGREGKGGGGGGEGEGGGRGRGGGEGGAGGGRRGRRKEGEGGGGGGGGGEEGMEGLIIFFLIDECSMSPCSDVCTNTDGSFECSCPDGMELNSDMLTCSGKAT